MLTTIRTKVVGDRFPAVRSLGDLLGRALQDLEIAARHDDVVAVQTAGDVATVIAMAEELREFVVSSV